MAEEQLGCTFMTAANAIEQLEELGLVREITGKQRNRLCRFESHLNLFEHQSPHVDQVQERDHNRKLSVKKTTAKGRITPLRKAEPKPKPE